MAAVDQMEEVEQPTDTAEGVEDMKPVVEEPKEKEENESPNTDSRYKDTVELNVLDATLNCVVSEKDVIESLPVDGTNLVAAARANIGITGGRYYYEVEILGTRGNGAEVLVGLSCAGSSLFLGEKETLCFGSSGSYNVNGEKSNSFRGQRFGKDDVVGLLLNRTEKGNANTVSLFVNGARAGNPQEIPESFDGALFPHVGVKMAIVSVNLTKHVLKKLPFTVRLVGDASVDDVTPASIKEGEAKVVIPMGFDSSEYIQNYTDAHVEDHFVQITNASIAKWMEKSGLAKKNLDQDGLRCIERMMAMRKRNYIYAMNHCLLSNERVTLAKRFPTLMKKIMVVSPSIVGKLPFNIPFSKDVTLPTAEEGFTVDHTDGENKSMAALELWQKRCKQQTIVADLKVGEFFKDNWAKWEKIRDVTRALADKKKKEREEVERKAAEDEGEEETPAAPEEKQEENAVKPSEVDCQMFDDEDWMLLDLRIELHLLVHAFREDVEDKDRVTFAADHLQHYYKLYHGKQFTLHQWGAKTVSECVEIISDTVKVEDGMLMVQNDKDMEFDAIIQQTEDARQNRCDRIGAGDEGATLKFKAPPRRTVHKGGNKAQKSQKGQRYMSNSSSKGQKSVGTQPMQRPGGLSMGSSQPLGSKGMPMKGKGGGFGYNQHMGNKGGKSGTNYQMRPVPQQGPGAYKRPPGPAFQYSAAKRPQY